MNNYGLIGDPIAKSLSPALFNAGFGGKYNYDLIEGASFGNSFKTFEERYKGINVTAPFKEDAFRRADIYTSYCSKIGAANILVKTGDGILADNSDFTGIILSIAEAYMPGLVRQFSAKYGEAMHKKVHMYLRQALTMLFSRKPQALIVGCGGAGRAAAVAAAELGFDTALMNRTPEKAQKIADEMPEYNFICDQMADFRAAIRECDLVIYTLPVKLDEIEMLTAEDFEGEDRYQWPRPGKVILEANYKNPSFSGPVIDKVNAGGAQYVPGTKWLLYQALTGYLCLTGKIPDLNAMEQVIADFQPAMDLDV